MFGHRRPPSELLISRGQLECASFTVEVYGRSGPTRVLQRCEHARPCGDSGDSGGVSGVGGVGGAGGGGGGLVGDGSGVRTRRRTTQRLIVSTFAPSSVLKLCSVAMTTASSTYSPIDPDACTCNTLSYCTRITLPSKPPKDAGVPDALQFVLCAGLGREPEQHRRRCTG